MPQIFNDPVLTDDGAQLLLGVENTDVGVTFTRCAIGDASYSAAEKTTAALKEMTDLKNERNTYGFTSSTRTAGELIMVSTISNYDEEHEQPLITTGYYITEIGIFAKAGSDPEILFAIAVVSGSTGEYIDAYDGVAPIRIVQDFTLEAGSQTQITLIYSPSQFAFADDFAALQANYLATKASIAPDEVSPAAAAHAEGNYIYYNGIFYKVIDDIAIGDALTVNANIEATIVGEELKFGGGGSSANIIFGVPEQSGTLTYTGLEQTCIWDSFYDTHKMTVTGNTATNAGTYTATFTPKSGFKWYDDSTGVKTATWSIGKAEGGLELDTQTITLSTGVKTGTVTCTVTGDGTVQATSSDTTAATVTISGNTATISAADDNGTATITFSVPATTNFTAAENKTVAVTVDTYSILGVKINLSDSNPSTWATYTDDAVGKTAGGSAFDSYDIYDIQSYTFKDGAEVKALSKTDCTKFADGTSASSAITGGTYDVMTKFKRGGYNIYKSDGYLYVKLTDAPNKSGFCYKAFQRGSTDLDEFYLGRYKGYIDGSGKLRSYSGVTPTSNKAINQFRTAAHANGNGYENSGFYQLVWRQCLYMVKYLAKNSQGTIGKGYTGGNAVTTTGSTNGHGDTYGTQTATDHMILFGLEDFWGNIWEYIDGVAIDTNYNILTNTDNFQDDGKGTGYQSTASGVSSNGSGYMTDVQGTNDTGFVYKAKGGSTTTYFCNAGSLNSSSVAKFGGHYGIGDDAGVCLLYINATTGISYADCGGRVMFLKKAS